MTAKPKPKPSAESVPVPKVSSEGSGAVGASALPPAPMPLQFTQDASPAPLGQKSPSQELASKLIYLRKLEPLQDASLKRRMTQALAQAQACAEAEPKAELGRLLGLLGRCYLGGGHDVHLLDLSLEVSRHVKKEEALPEQFSAIREKASKLPTDVVGILVYENKCVVLMENGQKHDL